MDDAEVVDADVREHRAACDFADGPNAGSGRGEALVRFDVSVCVELDARDVEADSLRVGGSAGGDEEVGALDYFLTTVGVFFEVNGDRLTGFARDLRDLCVQDDVDVFVGKKAMRGVADVFVLRRKEARIAADDGDVAAERRMA